MVKKAGYRCAVVAGARWDNGPETDRFYLERQAICRKDSLKEFARKVGGRIGFGWRASAV